MASRDSEKLTQRHRGHREKELSLCSPCLCVKITAGFQKSSHKDTEGTEKL